MPNTHPAAGLVDLLHRGIPIDDHTFDEVYEEPWRQRSARYWTPVAVALRASVWFEQAGGRRVLDIGSGAGKACIVGAMATSLDFVGVEHRGALVDVARRAAEALGQRARVTFVHDEIRRFDASPFDCMYLYNPFAENLYAPESCLDSTVELSESRFVEDIHAVERIFDSAPVGSKIITYFGFGGRIPNSFAPVRTAQMGDDSLRLWEKRRAKSTGYYVDIGHTAVRFGRIDPELPADEGVSGR